ncbi:MAG TPA: hypothetical protein PK335_14865 [Draconibacterium sp.]|nr:hypothetical protein [Draconibacterium sp.]
MQKLQLITLLFVLLISCQDREAAPVTIPVWLEPRIQELEASGCYGCSVTRYTYNDEFYYHVYCNYWSCSNCETYHYNGDLVDWSVTSYADFYQNKTRPIILWECAKDTSAP